MPTKEQVLKRVAEIEGIESELVDNEYAYGFPLHEGLWFWNPLDNPSDWAVLIEKYTLTLQKGWVNPGEWGAVVQGLTGGDWISHKSLPWAICLAIIESKGGMGDE